jgi:hypothetical protein
VTEDKKKYHNEELRELYSSPNVKGSISMSKLRRMKCAENVACMGEIKNYTEFVRKT